MNGYCNRVDEQPPVFSVWPPSSDVFGHVLRVSDPTLYLSEWIRGSCFVGTETENPIPMVVDYSQQVAEKLGVPRNRIAYFRHSSAAFAAVQCAIHDGVSIALGTNPVLDLEFFAEYNFAGENANVFRPGAKWTDLCKAFPERFSVIAAVKRAHEAGTRPCLGLIQNMKDKSYYR